MKPVIYDIIYFIFSHLFSSRTFSGLHDSTAGQLLLPQTGGSSLAFPERLLATANNDRRSVDDGPGGRTRQHGRDADQVSARFTPILLCRLRTAVGRVDTQMCRRPVCTRLLCHIIFEIVFSGHLEVIN